MCKDTHEVLRVPYTDQVLRGLALGIYHALQIPPCSTLKVTLGLSFVFTPCTLKFFSVVNAPTTTTTAPTSLAQPQPPALQPAFM